MADEIFKTIFQMDVDNSKIKAGLDEVNKKYIDNQNTIDDQKKKLAELQVYEEKLLQARSKTNNVNSAVKYNEAIKKTKDDIVSLTSEINKMSRSETQATKETQDFGRAVGVAFDATKVSAMRGEVAAVGKQFEGAGRAIDKPIEKTVSLRAQLRALKEQLANTDSDEEFLKLSIEAGKLEDKIGDAREAAAIFAQDNPFIAVSNSIKGVASDLFSLNFADAAAKSKLLVTASKQITFAQSIKGVKDLGTTLANVGKVLLTNPIFLIGAAIALIIANFSKLKGVGGLIGDVFIAIGRAIDVVIRAGKDLLDFIGLIDATKKSLEELIAFNDDLLKSYENFYKNRIAQLNSANKRVIELENENALKVLAVAKKQNEQIFKDLQERGSSTQDYFDAIRKMQENGAKANDAFTANVVRNNELEVKGNEKLIALNLQLADARQKNKEQKLTFEIPKDAPDQIKKLADLQIAQTQRQQKEEQRAAAIDLKDTNVIGAALSKIATKYALERLNIKLKSVHDILEAEKRLSNEQLEISKTNRDAQISIAQSQGTLLEEQLAEEKLSTLVDYYQAKEKLLISNIAKEKALGFETVTSTKELAALRVKAEEDVAKSADELSKLRKQLRLNEFDEATRHSLALFDIEKINDTKIADILKHRDSNRLVQELQAAKSRLKIIKDSNEKVTGEEEKAANEIAEIEAKLIEQRREERKQLTLEIIDGINQVTDATFQAINQQLAAQTAFVDKQIGIQQGRIDDAKNLAEKGNAELLQLEKKRLDDLNKEKEKYVRRQQSLIVIELVANTALAVAKAAAQGGVAAPFTIAATLIALVAGLAQAKAVAAQAAFYEGGLFEGEGFTGKGNARQESNAVGKKPYIYHKEEFIFNHKTTSKYKDIFQDIHKGNIDLRDWQHKVNAFETLKHQSPMVVNNSGELLILNDKLASIERAINGQATSIDIDANGFSIYLKNVQSRNDFIKNKLAKP